MQDTNVSIAVVMFVSNVLATRMRGILLVKNAMIKIMKKTKKPHSPMTKPNLLKLAQIFRKKLIKDFGKKCKDYDFDCIVCNCHRVVDGLENLAEYMGILDED